MSIIGTWMDFRGCCRPASGLIGVYLFFPSRLRPSPGRNDKCVKEVLRIAARARPSLRAIDFVDDLRFAEKGAKRELLFAGLAQPMFPLARLGVRYHAKGGNRRRPCRSTQGIGFSVDANSMEVKGGPSEQKRGTSLREAIMGLETLAHMSARMLLALVSRLGFLHWVVPGGSCHLRGG